MYSPISPKRDPGAGASGPPHTPVGCGIAEDHFASGYDTAGRHRRWSDDRRARTKPDVVINDDRCVDRGTRTAVWARNFVSCGEETDAGPDGDVLANIQWPSVDEEPVIDEGPGTDDEVLRLDERSRFDADLAGDAEPRGPVEAAAQPRGEHR